MNHFHDNNAWLIIGADHHFGIHWPSPIPMPMFFWELVFVHPYVLGGKQAGTVQLNGGHNAALDQYTSYVVWLHIPFSPDPLNMLFPLDMVFGKHKTWMPRGAVKIEGTSAAITVLPCMLSIDMDCWVGSTIPSSLVIQPGTVVTTPSWKDYLLAAFRLAVEVVKYIIAKGKAVKARYPNGKLPAAPVHYTWRNVFKNMKYVLTRSDVYGQRARKTFINTLGRELITRMGLPFDVKREGGKVWTQMQSNQKVAEWVQKQFGLDPKSVATSLAKGEVPGKSVGDVVTGLIPGWGAVEGWQAGGSQFGVPWD